MSQPHNLVFFVHGTFGDRETQSRQNYIQMRFQIEKLHPHEILRRKKKNSKSGRLFLDENSWHIKRSKNCPDLTYSRRWQPWQFLATAASALLGDSRRCLQVSMLAILDVGSH